jgi:hypothetical protein
VSIDRRTFIVMTTTLALAESTRASFPSELPGLLTSRSTGAKTDPDWVAFKIYGWNRLGDIPADKSETSSFSSTPENLNSDPVFITINQFWRTAWR